MTPKPKEIRLPQFMYEHEPSVHKIANEGGDYYLTEQILIDHGIHVYLKGVPRPQKGFADPHAIWALNMAKRYFIEPLKLAMKLPFSVCFPVFMILTHKKKINALQGILDTYNRMSYGPLEGFLLKPEFLCPIAQETRKLVKVFLLEIGISEDTSNRTSKIFSHFLEYDNAYRYRIQDLFSETSKTSLVLNPRKEMKRLLKLMSLRDDSCVLYKFRVISFIVSMLMFSRKFKKAIVNAIKSVDIERMGFDEDDRYWVCIRTDYKFFGKGYDERMKMIENEPKPQKVSVKDILKNANT